MNKRGQFTLFALLMVVVTVIAFISLYPVLNEIINDNLDQFSGGTQLLVRLTPFFILLMILVTGFYYANPNHQIIPQYR